jgi:HPt (histidine-containing phosphotransfer) domain-containing protein
VSSPLCDLAPLREAVEDPTVVTEILEAFRADARARLGGIESALDAHEPLTVAREAHALRGMALAVGARAVARGCEAVEGSAKAGDLSSVGPLVGELQGCLEATLAELRRELDALAALAAPAR